MSNPEPEPQPNPEDQWTGPSQDEWQEMMELKEVIAEAMKAPAEPTPTQTEPDKPQYNLNPWENENFGGDLEKLISDKIDQAVAPYSAHTEETILSEAESRAMDIIDSLAAEKGDLPDQGKTLVRALADNYIADAQTQYGFGPQAAEAALDQAYDDVKEIFETANKSYYETKMNELKTLGHAPQEPPANNTGAAQGLERVKGDELALVRNIFQRGTST